MIPLWYLAVGWSFSHLQVLSIELQSDDGVTFVNGVIEFGAEETLLGLYQHQDMVVVGARGNFTRHTSRCGQAECGCS